MNNITKDIFKAIHEGKWLSIEYRNKKEEVTKYWIGIRELRPASRTLLVDGLHLGENTVLSLSIYIDSIISSSIIDGTYCPVNNVLIEDITYNPEKYQTIFQNIANLKILNYYSECNRMDTTPYKCEYSLLKYFDDESAIGDDFSLSDEQFKYIVKEFSNKNKSRSYSIKKLALNVLSINTKDGLYVLAFRLLNLDVKNRKFVPQKDISVLREFTVEGNKQSIRRFLDAEDYELLNDFETNLELIKDKITQYSRHMNGVDDMPYLIALGYDINLPLEEEYKAIADMYENGTAPKPIQAFFGNYTQRSRAKKDIPIALLNKRVNLDQLLAINNGMKFPITYIQGPPGTGKTNTIINTISTAFFNEKTVLFCSYNNHPIDSVFDALCSLEYEGRNIPFPVIRLGNNEKLKETLKYIKNIYEKCKNIKVYDKTLEKKKDFEIERTEQLRTILALHEESIELKERREALVKLEGSYQHLHFQTELQGEQLAHLNERLKAIGELTDDDAQALLPSDLSQFIMYLYYTSAKYIKSIDEPKHNDLRAILEMDSEEDQVREFNKYLSKGTNLKKFMKIFPIMITTCISAHKLGEPEPYFDMVIMDEASQCNSAVALVSILRGNNLMLVGDPQQLNPVILLSKRDNQILKKRYHITNEYDYIENSIYKTFLACDAVSDEILLHNHYRCNKKIIDFNNKKFYNSKLKIMSASKEEQPLLYVDVKDNTTDYKNTSPAEIQEIIKFAELNKDKEIGVITPFVNQKDRINSALKENNLTNVSCGTVHAFQGDEKEVVIFSLAITDKTTKQTYDWLKCNKELINVATSRAKEKLIIMSADKDLERLHNEKEEDDLYDLVQYTKSNGSSAVASKEQNSRALGIKPYSSETENVFLENLRHALDNVIGSYRKCRVEHEVAINHVFGENLAGSDLFFTGRFDFVVYEKVEKGKEMPILAIELDGHEHSEDEAVMRRDKKKNEICRTHGFELIRVENSYARRYYHIKHILGAYFKSMK
ncbi:AAA domain-containing protein [[Clostridium] fimetarium]|uniref:Superfamily I DNA and/or RNA helicase n=1 Tax=[Clostridium] fimetarium TaxID=99656 RepID=A0A1I0NRU6_9FIRM|nr:AAA domain-containing protein [[Clostridium] fimetarium]SEW04197.1 Protein of unknown function [[Clostridium] fimetarium]